MFSTSETRWRRPEGAHRTATPAFLTSASSVLHNQMSWRVEKSPQSYLKNNSKIYKKAGGWRHLCIMCIFPAFLFFDVIIRFFSGFLEFGWAVIEIWRHLIGYWDVYSVYFMEKITNWSLGMTFIRLRIRYCFAVMQCSHALAGEDVV